jgi:hypothetical protein
MNSGSQTACGEQYRLGRLQQLTSMSAELTAALDPAARAAKVLREADRELALWAATFQGDDALLIEEETCRRRSLMRRIGAKLLARQVDEELDRLVDKLDAATACTEV